MHLDVQEEENVVVVSIAGELDASSAPQLRQRLDELVGQGKNNFILDLSELDFLDSSGIAAFVSLYKKVRLGKGDVKICKIKPEIMKIFELTRLNRVFDIYHSRAEAVANFL